MAMSSGVMRTCVLDLRPSYHQVMASVVHVEGWIQCGFASVSRCLIRFVDPSVHFPGSMPQRHSPRSVVPVPAVSVSPRRGIELSASAAGLALTTYRRLERGQAPFLTVEPGAHVCPMWLTASRCVSETPCTRDAMHLVTLD